MSEFIFAMPTRKPRWAKELDGTQFRWTSMDIEVVITLADAWMMTYTLKDQKPVGPIPLKATDAMRAKGEVNNYFRKRFRFITD